MESIFDEGLKYSVYDRCGSNTLFEEDERAVMKEHLALD